VNAVQSAAAEREEDGEDVEVTDEGDDADGEDDDGDDVDDSDLPSTLMAHPDVHTHFIFPQFTEKRFVVGEKVTALISFANRGQKIFNITAVGAHLHSPFDFSYYIQNFTAREVDATVHPGHEQSIEYVFVPDKSLEPLEFWLSAWVQYNDSNDRVFRTTYTNGTIELVEKPSEFNPREFFTWVVTLAVIGVVVYFVFVQPNQSSGSRSSSRAAQKGIERGTRGAEDDGGWGNAYVPKTTAARVSKKKDKKPKASS